MQEKHILRVAYQNAWNCSVEGSTQYLISTVRKHDITHIQELNRSSATVPRRYMPEDRGHRLYPMNTKCYDEVATALNGAYDAHFAAHFHGEHDLAHHPDIQMGNGFFIRAGCPISQFHQRIYHGRYGKLTCAESPAARSGEAVCVLVNEQPVVVGGTHAVWWHGDKGDVRTRRLQIERQLNDMFTMCQLAREQYGVWPIVVFGGDLNLRGDTDIIKQMIPEHPVFGFSRSTNLCARHGITDTRTALYPDSKPGREADYVFVSNNAVATLLVDRDVPSDHALLSLTLSW